MAHHRKKVLTAVGGVVVLLVSGCAGQDQAGEFEDHQPPSHFPQEPLADLEDFYDQDPDWHDCADGPSCGSVTVPRDYSDPDGETIEIEFVADTLENDSFLVMNPGGPGASGFDIVADQAHLIFTSELREAYNIVGFDPRGVARSEPMACMDDAEYDLWNQLSGDDDLDGDVLDELGLETSEFEEVLAQCEQLSGDIMEHLDTVSSARDMDILRSALGEDELHYFGMSYGSKLGLAFAEMFPDRVGRWVLDAVMDVSLSINGITEDQAAGFERQLRDFTQWCADHDRCPVEGDAEAVMEAISDRVDELWDEPAEGPDGRRITAETVFSGISTTMYVPDGHLLLLEALQTWVTQDNPEVLQYIADIGAGRNEDGSYDWISSWSFRTIMCLDYPEEGEGVSGPGLLEGEEAPFAEQFISSSTEFCDVLPGEREGMPWEPSEDLPPMLLVGGTQDPATPVEWAESVHEKLPQSSLLIYDGDGHISYAPSNQCVTEIVDEYFISGELFEGRQDC